jgi:ElaA protein
MEEALHRIADARWGGPIRLAAQMYLESFYEAFEFRRASDPYLDDDIWHVDMVRD